MQTTIIGIDCAVSAKNVGLALALDSGKDTVLERVCLGNAEKKGPAHIVARWIRERDTPMLLALDAPLGWPEAMGRMLPEHRAGEELQKCANTLFRRETDRFVKREIGKTPLSVGADKIARTAHAALALIGELRGELAEPIPLVWSPAFQGVGAIEVYPAATLKAHGISGSKDDGGPDGLVAVLAKRLHIPGDIANQLASNPHMLDAAVCVLAAQDFLCDKAMPPLVPALAKREGWIWVRDPAE